MKTAFPICQVDGSQFNDVSALKVLLNGQTSGRYIISKGRGWHGGIHFNNRIAFWAQHFQPVQAMADGELVAYRMAEEYPTTQYLETTSSYSNNFCLLRHTFQNPDQEDESYTFYSLYMHLQSQKEIQDSITAAESVSEIHYIRLTQTWYVRGDVTTTDFETKTLMPVGTVIQLTDPSRASVTKKKAGTNFWDFLKCKVVQVGKFADNERDRVSKQSAADQKLDQEIWLSVSKYNGETAEYCLPALADVLTKQMPPWHTKNGPENNLPIVADGTVQVPELPINIKAGEHLGYLGKYEYLKNAQGNIDQEYRVHLEVFSNDRPPEYFLKALSGGQEEHGFQVIDGSSSTGVMEPANTFFNDIRRAIDTDNDGQISENELVAFYQAATNRLEKVIAKHPSEWYFKAEEHWFNQVLAMSQKLTEASLSRYFDSTESYMSSEFRKNFVQSYDSFAIHEKERIDNTSWMQDINPEKLDLKPEVWHFWPLTFTGMNIFTLGLLKEVTSGLSDTHLYEVLFYLNKYARKFSINSKLRAAHFVSQLAHESNFELDSESGYYSVSRMQEIFGNENIPSKKRTKLWTQPNKYSQNPRALLSYVYADRMGNGNEESEEGYKYRGQGLIQLTGKSNYETLDSYLNDNGFSQFDVVENPELLLNNMEVAVLAAFHFWEVKDINSLADLDNLRRVTFKVNGGYNGISDREIKLNKAKEYYGI